MARNPFKRNQTDQTPAQTQGELPVVEQEQPNSNLPKEVQDYYESGKRERRGMVWLLGIGTLLVTLLLAAGIFFGGRWIYRQLTNDDQAQDTAQIGENDQKSDQNKSTNNSSGSNSQNQNNSNNSNSSNQGQPSQPKPTPTPAPAPKPAPTTPKTPTPAPAPTPTATPNTGPGDVVAIVFATTILSTAGFYAIQLKKQTD